ncbi:C6 transcription factor [Pyrenophora seminiperda CCB06]|uniref:C6 transcription factor n=1 Tax=Pyrenophora seminiperda CCB06 TaxID=1302712 RepID=A0A3M7MCB8_9PLEO|nr:C6 transcription factor [Pyrenophora seminiperda CCB06]
MASQCFDKCPSVATLSHHRPLPTRKRQHENRCCRVPVYLRVSPHLRFNSCALFMFLIIVFLSCGSLAAPILEAETHGDRPAFRAEDDDLAWRKPALYLDSSPPPPLLMPPLQIDDDATNHDPSSLSKRAIKTDPTAAATDFNIPRAFDTGLSSNFSSSCANFLHTLRQSQDFNSCDPFSLLIQTSSGFFDASKSTLRITQTLDATCGVDSTKCKTIMDSFAIQLLKDTACKSDYKSDNPVVLQAYNGLIAYQPAYKASCLHDSGGNYCFADAVSNTSSPGDAYPYYLPIGQQLPGGSRPTCNSCLQQAMGVFAVYSNNATQPISKTYTSAAQQISIACGSNFVNVTAAPLKGAAAPTMSTTFTPTITLFLMFVLFFFH